MSIISKICDKHGWSYGYCNNCKCDQRTNQIETNDFGNRVILYFCCKCGKKITNQIHKKANGRY